MSDGGGSEEIIEDTAYLHLSSEGKKYYQVLRSKVVSCSHKRSSWVNESNGA